MKPYKTSTFFKQIMIAGHIPNAKIVNVFKEKDERGERLCLEYEILEEDMQTLRALLNKTLPLLSQKDFKEAKKHRHDMLKELFEAQKNKGE